MKTNKLILSFFLAFLIWRPSYATTTRGECLDDLKKLIVPTLTHNVFVQKGYGKKIQIDVDDYNDGVYNLRLTLSKNPSPDNPNTSDTVGWVRLDVKKMKAYDESIDPDHPTELKLNSDELNSIVKKCSL